LLIIWLAGALGCLLHGYDYSKQRPLWAGISCWPLTAGHLIAGAEHRGPSLRDRFRRARFIRDRHG